MAAALCCCLKRRSILLVVVRRVPTSPAPTSRLRLRPASAVVLGVVVVLGVSVVVLVVSVLLLLGVSVLVLGVSAMVLGVSCPSSVESIACWVWKRRAMPRGCWGGGGGLGVGSGQLAGDRTASLDRKRSMRFLGCTHTHTKRWEGSAIAHAFAFASASTLLLTKFLAVM